VSRRPRRLIRLAQHLAVALGLEIDQDSDSLTEEELRELLNAAIDYVESAEEYRSQRSPYILPNIIGVGGQGGGYSTGTWTTSPPYTMTSSTTAASSHSHGKVSDHRFLRTDL
jgi:hypothetical protein